jgi:hypothetical protein
MAHPKYSNSGGGASVRGRQAGSAFVGLAVRHAVDAPVEGPVAYPIS